MWNVDHRCCLLYIIQIYIDDKCFTFAEIVDQILKDEFIFPSTAWSLFHCHCNACHRHWHGWFFLRTRERGNRLCCSLWRHLWQQSTCQHHNMLLYNIWRSIHWNHVAFPVDPRERGPLDFISLLYWPHRSQRHGSSHTAICKFNLSVLTNIPSHSAVRGFEYLLPKISIPLIPPTIIAFIRCRQILEYLILHALPSESSLPCSRTMPWAGPCKYFLLDSNLEFFV